METKVGPIETRAHEMQTGFGQIETKAIQMDTTVGQIQLGVAQIEARVGQVETKLSNGNVRLQFSFVNHYRETLGRDSRSYCANDSRGSPLLNCFRGDICTTVWLLAVPLDSRVDDLLDRDVHPWMV
jgi:hypothetical protein